MKVLVKNLQKIANLKQLQPKKIAYKTISRLKFSPQFSNLEINIYFVKNSIIKKLNKRFFNKDSLTDVISFNLGSGYAEIFIAPVVVKSNALSLGIGFKEELYRCIIHGTLHIFGFTDKIKKEKVKMWRMQEVILEEAISGKD